MSAIQSFCLKADFRTKLTGDAEAEAHRISQLLNIPVLASGALPGDKAAFIAELQSKGHKVAMVRNPHSTEFSFKHGELTDCQVGDGINDAPALAAADVGIQLSLPRQGGSPGAGNILLIHQDLKYLPRLFDMASQTMKRARLNIYHALGYNVLALLFAVGAFESWGWKANP